MHQAQTTNTGDAPDDIDRPVPQPRRNLHAASLHAKAAATAYENVHIELLNKCTTLNNDNLLNNDTNKSPRSKVPNNKAFLLLPAQPADADHDDNGNQMPSSPMSAMSPTARRIVITEMNNLNLDQPAGHYKNCANKNFEDSHKMQNMPVPAPRRLAAAPTMTAQQQQQADEIYESNEDTVQPQAAAMSSASSSAAASPVPYKPDRSTGAISKTPSSVLPPPSLKCNNIDSSSGNAISTASGVLVDGAVGVDYPTFASDLRPNRKLNKSNVSLNSSTSGGSSSPAGVDASARNAKGSPRYFCICIVICACGLVSHTIYHCHQRTALC